MLRRLAACGALLALLPSTTLQAAGGDDRLVEHAEEISSKGSPVSLGVTEGGILLAAVAVQSLPTGDEIRVFRSIDGGDHWTLWGTIGDSDPASSYVNPSLHVTRGTQDFVFVAYETRDTDGFNIGVARADPAANSATFMLTQALHDTQVSYTSPDLHSDAVHENGYTLFLVASGGGSDGSDLWFTRSTDFGANWESGYEAVSVTDGSADLRNPVVRYGAGGVVHCVWQVSPRAGNGDRGIQYCRALNRAASGLADWQPISLSTGTANNENEQNPDLAPSHANQRITLSYARTQLNNQTLPPIVRVSSDDGVTWNPVLASEMDDFITAVRLLTLPQTQGFALIGRRFSELVLRRTPDTLPQSWGPSEFITDDRYNNMAGGPGVGCVDVSRGDRIAVLWTTLKSAIPDTTYFDAEWRGDPGYPKLHAGFPITLPAAAIGPPAIADVDGGPTREIVIPLSNGQIAVLDHTGAMLPGWPVSITGSPVAEAGCALADVTGDSQLECFLGNTSGSVFGFDASGTALPNWPASVGTTAPVRVSIANLGSGPEIVTTSGKQIRSLDFSGQIGSIDSVFSIPGSFAHSAALGDIDLDGQVEVVAVAGPDVVALNHDGSGLFGVKLGGGIHSASDAATLADLDLAGNREVLVPTNQGFVYVFDSAGNDFMSWPWNSGVNAPIASLAPANLSGDARLELAVAIRDQPVWVRNFDGSTGALGWPNTAGGAGALLSMPIIDRFADYSPAILLGTAEQEAFLWQADGSTMPGWPLALPAEVKLSPASGDVDDDGRLDFVVVSDDQLFLYRTDGPIDGPVEDLRWPMYAFDPARTGCQSCDISGPTDAPAPGSAAIRLAAPRPNPAAGAVAFQLAVPHAGYARLTLYDASGRAVRQLLAGQLIAGETTVEWRGRLDGGERATAGVYFAELSFEGRREVRKVAWLP